MILDDIWAWRADHGNGVGWTVNTADTGVVVNGDDVTAYGLFVEHYQKYEVIWNGNRGTVVFFQNEMPYDPPSQAAWMEAPGVDGWAAFKIADSVTSFSGYGMGSYSFFNQGIDIFAAHAFEVPDTLPPGSLHDLLDDLPRSERRQGRDPQRRQRHRRVLDRRQPGRPGHGRELPVASEPRTYGFVASSLLGGIDEVVARPRVALEVARVRGRDGTRRRRAHGGRRDEQHGRLQGPRLLRRAAEEEVVLELAQVRDVGGAARILEPCRTLFSEELLLPLVGHVATDEGSAHPGKEAERRSDNRRPPLEHCPPPIDP